MQTGFVHLYSRGKPLASGNVEKKLKSVLQNCDAKYQSKLTTIHEDFSKLVIKRNALIHAHPCTDNDGRQILNYQTETDREVPDMKWPISEVETLIREIDMAAVSAGELLDRIR